LTTIIDERIAEPELSHAGAARRAFFGLFYRDLTVVTRQLPMFALQTVVQPLLMLFVFGALLSKLGMVSTDYSNVLFPGVVSITLFLSTVQYSSVTLSFEWGYTRELEDRLLAPLPLALVAAEKLIFAAAQGMFAGLCILPVGWLTLPGVAPDASGLPLLLLLLLMGALAGAGLGMWLVTWIPQRMLILLSSLVITPLLFTGCAQYPWPSLSAVPALQVICLLNPLTYLSEGARAALSPHVPHLNTALCVGLLLLAAIGANWLAIRGFIRHSLT
jgi:ABC-2 type transport system permease protein